MSDLPFRIAGNRRSRHVAPGLTCNVSTFRHYQRPGLFPLHILKLIVSVVAQFVDFLWDFLCQSNLYSETMQTREASPVGPDGLRISWSVIWMYPEEYSQHMGFFFCFFLFFLFPSHPSKARRHAAASLARSVPGPSPVSLLCL